MNSDEPTPHVPDRLAAATDGSVLLTLDEGSDVLGVGRSTVCELVASGELRSVKIGRARRISVAAIRDFVADLESGNGSVG